MARLRAVRVRSIIASLAGVLLVAGNVGVLAPPVKAAAPAAPTVIDYTSGLPSHSYLQGVVSGSDGNVWFADGGATIGEIDPHTGVIQTFANAISGATFPTDLVSGPDGNLWFTDAASAALGTFSLASHQGIEIKAGLQPGGVSTPQAIATGPDGNLWFTDPADGGTGGNPSVGKINPSTHAISEYPVRGGGTPEGIVAGPDGRLWFAIQGSTAAIGAIDPATGQMSIYTTGLNTGSSPYGITAGPDGNLWFTDQGATKAIGSINPKTGTINEYSAGLLAFDMPLEIAAGPDGNLWFTDYAGSVHAIGEVDLQTSPPTIAEYTADNVCPNYIAEGPGGTNSLWFTDICGGGLIGEIEPASGSSPPPGAPQLSSVSPATGTAGTAVTLDGQNLTTAQAVYFGGTAGTCCITNGQSGTVTAWAPAGTGSVAVTVYTPAGASTLPQAFGYQPYVAYVNPQYGPPAGGSQVTVQGSGLSVATVVYFGGAAGTIQSIAPDGTSLTALSPPGTGTVDVTVATPFGASTPNPVGGTFGYGPERVAIDPPAGEPGTLALIEGHNLASVTQVRFGSTPATIVGTPADDVVAVTVPPGSGTVSVTLSETGGSAATSFTYQPPQVALVDPNSGASGTGGQNVTIYGDVSLSTVQAVYFGSLPASFSVNPDGSLNAVAPIGAVGSVDVTMVTPQGTSVANPSFDQFTYEPVGSIAGQVTDASGDPVPGTTVQACLEGTTVCVSSVTDADGHYQLTHVVVGTYLLEDFPGSTPSNGLPALTEVIVTAGAVADGDMQYVVPIPLPSDMSLVGGVGNAQNVPVGFWQSPLTVQVTAPAGGIGWYDIVPVDPSAADPQAVQSCAPHAMFGSGIQTSSAMGKPMAWVGPTDGWIPKSTMQPTQPLTSEQQSLLFLENVNGLSPSQAKLILELWTIFGIRPDIPSDYGLQGQGLLPDFNSYIVEENLLNPLHSAAGGGGKAVYQGDISPVWPAHGLMRIDTTIAYPDGTVRTSCGNLYIDPSGVVQTPGGTPVAGAQVTLEDAPSYGGTYTPVPNGSDLMSPTNRQNPVTTDATGSFSWDVAPGYYEVSAQKVGCSVPGNQAQTAVSTPPLVIPPPAMGLVLQLECGSVPLSATSTSLAVSSPTVVDGGGVLLTATVTAANPPPAGTVSFILDGSFLASAPVDPTTGTAAYVAEDLAIGSHVLTAAYTGDGSHGTSVSGPETVTVTADQPPTLTAVAATSGNASGGDNLVLSGQNLTGATAVDFGGTQLDALAVNSSGQYLTVSVPAGSGSVSVSVTNAAGTSNALQFTYPVGTSGGGGGGGSGGGGSGGGGSGGGVSVMGAPTEPSVGPGGGVLKSTDGSFTMTVPAGLIPTGGSLSVGTSTTAPSGTPALPPGFTAVSPFVTLTGATLSQPVSATLDYTASAGEAAMTYTDGAWHYVPSTVGPGGGSASFYVTGPGTFVGLAVAVNFPDVPSGDWAQTYIQTLVAAGIANGFPDGTFQPDGTLTRAQFVKMLDLTLNLPAGAAPAQFRDVASGVWYAPYVAAAVAAGLVQGTSATTFSPDAAVTREQVAVLLARALKLTGGAKLGFTDDARIDGWAKGGVAAAAAAGFLNGFPDGSFRPLDPTTRAQAAKVLALAITGMAPKAS